MSLSSTRQVAPLSLFPRWTWPLVLSMTLAPALLATAQYTGHTQKEDPKKPATPRAIAVLEWVGDPTKPVASRIVPIAVFVNGQYQDGGLYMAQPAPLTVETDTLYELEQAGVPKGNFYVAGGENVDGVWFGYGQWKPLGTPKPVKKLKPSKNPPKVIQDADPDRPHFNGGGSSGSQSGSTSGSSTPSSSTSSTSSPASTDPDKPSLHRRTGSDDTGSSASSGGTSGSGTASSSGTTTASTASDDPDKPTLHRRSDTASTDSSGAGTAPDDPDRPHMKKHSDATAASSSGGDPGSPVSSVNEADPDRPKLSRGQPVAQQQALQADKLSSLPPELQQMAAVSDESVREEHGFSYPWPSPDDATKMQAAVEALAITVAQGGDASSANQKPVSASKPVPPRTTGGPRNTLSHMVPLKPPPVVLSEKDFRAYELSYNGGATIVFTAKATIGPNNAGVTTEKYITLIAQPDFDGDPQIRFKSVTTTKDLDITPRMRLVDAIDTEGKGRADLIFELRRATDRQFAIYHVQGTHAEQAFATESLPFGTPHHNAETKDN